LTGHVIFTMPFMVRSVMAVFATIDIRTLDEGAASLGASPARRFLDVIVPNAVPGILAGALMVVTLSLGEFNLTWMLHTPLTKTLPIGLADSYASMRLEVASAYTLIFFIMIIPLLIAMQMFADQGQGNEHDRIARRLGAYRNLRQDIYRRYASAGACHSRYSARRNAGSARPLGLR
jgi:putative spermidine/putrescine transport system permease protein